MDPIVCLFPRRFLWKLNQAADQSKKTHLLLGLFTARRLSIFLDILSSCSQILISSLLSSTTRQSNNGSSLYIKPYHSAIKINVGLNEAFS